MKPANLRERASLWPKSASIQTHMKSRFLLAFPVLLFGCAALAKPKVVPAKAAPAKANAAPRAASMPISSGKAFDFQSAAKRASEAGALVASQNDFGARLIVRLEQQNAKHENLLASPTSLWQALAMTSGGARGQTKAQMSALLSMEHLPDGQIGAENRAFNALLGEQKGASISVANSLWFADSFQANRAFVANSKANFGAGVERFPDAKPEEGATRINAWVSAHTKHEITHIVQTGDIVGQSSVLVNAVYFRGGWQDVFDKSQTKPAPFHLMGGKTIQQPTMNARRSHAYLSGTSFEGARLPYKNTSCALWVLLPKSGQTPADVLRELGQPKSKKLNAIGSVILSLPRFEVEWRENVAPDLAKMASLPFSRAADFSAMGQPTMGISLVLHVCKMRVDEEGTVAAAATVVAMARSAAPKPEEPKVLKFDRPFVVALVEETSGARLFEGTVYDPSAK